MTSLFASVELAPRDPILGLNEQYNTDTRTQKVNLGVGVYYNDEGRIPLLKAVRKAEVARIEAAAARGYLPIDGLASYNRGAQILLLGADSPLIAEGRVLTVQALGGTGALKIGADFLRRLLPNSKAYISNPSWENHRALFERASFKVETYAYYNSQTHGIDFPGMLAALKAMPEQSVVVLHACCHNPTGVDPSIEQWAQIAQAVKEANLVPFIDIAYQGLGDGLEKDAAVVRMFADLGLTVLISSSFSKSFSLYGERVGALTLITASQEEKARVLSQIKRVIRTNYSNPPTHGGMIVASVLNTPELYASWTEELAGMRDRIHTMRKQLVEKLKSHGAKQNFDFITAQRGMFSYTGLSTAQVERLRNDYGVYAVSSGRICVAALNSRNVDYVAEAIAKIIA
jgi:aromatic-amino-acid transaminase